MSFKTVTARQIIKKAAAPARPFIKKMLPAPLLRFFQTWITFFLGTTTLHLMRSDANGLPSPLLPEGYSCAPLKKGHEADYIHIMRDSLVEDADPEWFSKTFSGEPFYDPQNLICIYKDNQPVAAASAWQRTWKGATFGIVHMVGVAKNHRRKGLGRAIVLLALHRLKELKLLPVIIGTMEARIPAICLYLSLGFKPFYMHTAERIRWKKRIAEAERAMKRKAANKLIVNGE